MNSEIKSFLNQGNKAFRDKQYELAVSLYQKALETSPTLERLIVANIELSERKMNARVIESLVNQAITITKAVSEDHNQQPDFFNLKSQQVLADFLIVSWVQSQSELIRILQLAHRITTAFEMLILLPRDLHDSLTISKMPAHCQHLQMACFPEKTKKSGAFIRTLNAGVFSKYSDLLWIDRAESIKLTAEHIEQFCAKDSYDTGIFADELIRCDQVKSEFRDQYLGRWLARLHRPNINHHSLIPTGSFCVKALVLNQIAAMNITPGKFDSISNDSDRQAFETISAAIGITSHEGMLRSRDSTETNLTANLSTKNGRTVKAIAFYLPQFHPIPENDRWWGKGFTEWNNVIRAKPLFRSHYQPKLPADLGYYDLRSEAAQTAQADLATKFGVHGFCYYYYWFNGKKLLNQPIENMLKSGKPDFPFCVCWANENWSRNWDGQNKHVLMEQHYDEESNRALIREFIEMMKDSRYIRHNGKPVLLVYRIKIIPNWLSTAKMWRQECRDAGIGEIHLCSIRFGLEPLEGMPSQHGLDSYVLFPPQDMSFVDARSKVHDLNTGFGGTMYGYDDVVDGDIARFRTGYEWPVHRGAMLGWDNTARRMTSSRVFVGCTPMRYRSWLAQILEQEDRHNANSESLLFINAWNEWAEGTTLEPDQKFGTAYLEATKSVLDGYSNLGQIKPAHPTEPPTSLSQKIRYQKPTHVAELPKYWPGEVSLDQTKPSILLCAHISGHHLFGGERSFLDVIKSLNRLGYNLIVTLPSSNNKEYISMIATYAVGIYSFGYPQWIADREADPRLTLQFCDLIAKHSISIVYSNTIVLLEPAQAARKLGRISITHIRELITLDDALRDRIGLPVQDIIKTVFRRYDFAVANSLATQKAFSRADRTFYAPNAVDYLEIATPNQITSKIKFGIVSSNIPKKGISDFIEVAKLCTEISDIAEFIVVGPDNPHTHIWKKQIASGELPNNIKFVGYRDSPKSAMAELNVLLNLSTFAESFGRTVAEAMAANRPVIAYEWGALPELVLHEQNGYLAPFGDTKAVAHFVRTLANNPKLIKKLGATGFKFITNNFSHVSLQKKLDAAFSKIKSTPEWQALKESGLDKSQSNTTTVIIPVFNAPKELQECLDSVLLHTPSDVKILVIDDGSTDIAISELLKDYAQVESIRILKNESNIGYTKTINRGIKEAQQDDIILLNSDTIVTPYWIQGMRASAYSDHRIGTVTAMSDNAGAFSFPNQGVSNPKPDYLTHDEYAAQVLYNTFDTCHVEVPTGSGFCLYIRRALIDQIGDFDAKLFPRGYGEENDFCMRAREFGWKNVITPWVFIFHVRTASFKGEKEKLVKLGVDQVTKKYPNYAKMVNIAFSSPEMMDLRKLSATCRNLVPHDKNI